MKICNKCQQNSCSTIHIVLTTHHSFCEIKFFETKNFRNYWSEDCYKIICRLQLKPKLVLNWINSKFQNDLLSDIRNFRFSVWITIPISNNYAKANSKHFLFCFFVIIRPKGLKKILTVNAIFPFPIKSNNLLANKIKFENGI